MSASYWPDVEVVRLVDVADVAVEEIHEPRVGRAAGVGRRRPIVVGLDTSKRTTRWQGGIIPLGVD